jgi:hypothetical protein
MISVLVEYININAVVNAGAPIDNKTRNPIRYEHTAKNNGKVRLVLSVISISVCIFLIRIKDVVIGRNAPNIQHIMVITIELLNPNRT